MGHNTLYCDQLLPVPVMKIINIFKVLLPVPVMKIIVLKYKNSTFIINSLFKFQSSTTERRQGFLQKILP